jgi:TP901-1 family phage major tail protein
MAILNGTAYLLKIGSTNLPDQTEGSISINTEVIDVSNKDSLGFRDEIQLGMRSGSISVSGLVDDGNSDAVDTLMATFSSRASVSVVFGLDGTVTGEEDHNFSATAFVTSLEVSAGTEDNVTYSATLELSGTITFDNTAEA